MIFRFRRRLVTEPAPCASVLIVISQRLYFSKQPFIPSVSALFHHLNQSRQIIIFVGIFKQSAAGQVAWPFALLVYGGQSGVVILMEKILIDLISLDYGFFAVRKQVKMLNRGGFMRDSESEGDSGLICGVRRRAVKRPI